MPVKVAVIGGGIIGLAATAELARAGAEVRCYEAATVAGAQSKGTTRIFRHAHGDPRLVELAVRASGKWSTWEMRFGRRLVGPEGLIITGDEIVPLWERAMQEGGAPSRSLTRKEGEKLLPIAKLPDCAVLFDPAGGATRVRRTVDLLRADIGQRLYLQRVEQIDDGDGGCVITTAADTWQCDEIVIAAGIDTSALAAQVDLAIPVNIFLHSRFTFLLRDEYRDRSLSCWIDDSGLIGNGWHSYCQPVGTTGRYAVGVSWEAQQCTPEVGADVVGEESRAVAQEYVRQALPGVDPTPVDEIRCIFNEYSFSDGGDGFMARRRGRVTAFYGNNLFKFAPLIGDLLKDTVVNGALPPELQPAAIEA